MGRVDESLRAFEAASRFTPSAQSFVNLGVCYMRAASGSRNRQRKVEMYRKSKEAMMRGRELATSAQDHKLHDENWKALETNLEIERIEEDDVDPRQCGASPRWEPPAVGPTPHQRDFLVHQRDAPVARPLPRVSVEDVDGSRFAERREAFVLVGATRGWGAVKNTSAEAWAWLRSLAARWPRAVTDFYPYNMLTKDRQAPFLTRLPRAVEELGKLNGDRSSTFRYDRRALEGRYMHLQLTPESWAELEARADMVRERHRHLENDGWVDECFGDDEVVRREYHLKTHWKIVLAGARGAGMFNHSDSLQTSSWHAHLAGRKWWYVCDAGGACFEGILEPGDILYYGRGWSHETQNLETPTITITDTVVHERNFAAVADKLHSECARQVLDFRFSAALCDALDLCYNAMHLRFAGTPKPPRAWPPWRLVAGAALVEQREATSPADNNYDGRNYITE
ncbi:hypothetical protein CTAYLR_009432 [Chrysophaeum taylorii]|uniref:JmjC domain-containing protein n=1 Tax=Chrysophaeum taylorii TaxID=2483200 RepID=A0AAD7UJH5_9STRA|nr:hypothetical protein CTAYLR_009432 [Chrysophaeum taylorii]